VARPKKYIVDKNELEKLASYGCSVNDCAEFFNCPPNIISKSYSEIYTKGFNSLKKRLRMSQLQLAFKGNATMLIWLGKQYLEQSDRQEIDLSGKLKFEKIEVVVVHKDRKEEAAN